MNRSSDAEILFPALHKDPYFGPQVMQELAAARSAVKHAEEILVRIDLTRRKLQL